MDSDLTFNSIDFKKQWDSKSDGSSRQSTARAINTPDIMTIKNQTYTDSGTKVPGVRTSIRFDRVDVDPSGDKYISSLYLVAQVPEKASSSDIAALVATFKAAVADADLIANALNGEL